MLPWRTMECVSVGFERPALAAIIAPMASVFSGVDWNPIAASAARSDRGVPAWDSAKTGGIGSAIGSCIATTVCSAARGFRRGTAAVT